MCQNRRRLSLVHRLAFGGREAVSNRQFREPRMYWRHNQAAVKLDRESQERLGGFVRDGRACPGVGSSPRGRTSRRAPSPRPSPSGRGRKIVVTPRWEWVHRTGGRLGAGRLTPGVCFGVAGGGCSPYFRVGNAIRRSGETRGVFEFSATGCHLVPGLARRIRAAEPRARKGRLPSNDGIV